MKFPRSKTISGFSLVEVLVALVVLTIGLLGMAGLQGYSITGSYNAHLRTQATALAQGMIDRMRANPQQATTGQYNTNFGDAPTGVADCISAACTATQMKDFDLREWKCNLGNYAQTPACTALVSQSTLPLGDGEIATPNAGQIQVTVQWSDTAGDTHQVMLTTAL